MNQIINYLHSVCSLHNLLCLGQERVEYNFPDCKMLDWSCDKAE